MIADFCRAVVQGLVEPRQSVRRLMMGDHGLPVALGFIVLAHLIASILQILTPGVEQGAQLSVVGRHLGGIVSGILVFFLFSGLVYFFGRISGGTGTRAQTQVTIAWHSVVTSLMTPAFARLRSAFVVEEAPDGKLSVTGTPDGAVVFMGILAVGFSTWLLAQYVTELHGFRNFWGVLAVFLAIPFIIFYGLFMMAGFAAVQ